MKSHPFQDLSPTTLADVLTRDNVMDIGIRPLWQGMPRIAGPAFTVRCPAGDNLMLHAAIYRAPAGSIIVVESADTNYAVAVGNVCAVAQKHGIVGFVVDGVIRDLAEARENHFPVFARGVIPVPGGKNMIDKFNAPIRCGGVAVAPRDIVVADEEGTVVVPHSRSEEILKLAKARAAKDAAETLETWESNHRTKIEEILEKMGFKG
jgi:4-hydroxy-4-methyl-2-oxoglutarate aldolase